MAFRVRRCARGAEGAGLGRLVELKPRRGCYVTEISRQDLDDIFPLMAILEGRCAADVVKAAKPADIEELREIHARLEAAAREGRISAFFEANQAFHRRIQELASNQLAVVGDPGSAQGAQALAAALTIAGRAPAAVARRTPRDHGLEAGEVAKTEKLMHDHLLSGREALAKMDSKATKAA